ncbi:beta-1,4-N-acetylgalactosaminyltransferase bre-4-like [Pectinophora gossypiella]|uniref:beta-1,4-N-acetylgalactosaminyltransferase bre-4-like n=1 Tax=Pectinophora gossypiella TaxID=13191 RepID=UPI00214F4172|nr:beta-1,4-N-acetylgalactosaminyltransferase bre-4-like [Pectinophora gossypiella]
MHPFLIHQKLEYRIFIVEQYGNKTFNKGRVFNAGFKEVMKYEQWRCIIFHDVDLLPLNSRILYSCPSFPRHMSPVFFNSKGVRFWYAMFGGVTAMTPAHYEQVNGHSNLYWGWGAEDNDMYWRLRGVGLPVFRYDKIYAQYLALPHQREPENPDRYKLLHTSIDRWKLEGLNDIEYNVISTKLEHLYTHIVVDIDIDP